MKFLLHLPGLVLCILCGVICWAIGWERAEDYFADEYERLQGML